MRPCEIAFLVNIKTACFINMVSLGVSSPTRKSLPSPIWSFPKPFQVTRSPPPSFQFPKIVQGIENSIRVPFIQSRGKICGYMYSYEYKEVNKTRTINKTRTKYSKEVSEKGRSQFSITFDKSDFLTIQPVIEYLFKRDNLRL